MKYFQLFVILSFLFASYAFAADKNKRYGVEVDDLIYKIHKTHEKMIDCMENNNKTSCKIAAKTIDKNPWLLTRKVYMADNSGYSQDEWDAQVGTLKKELDEIGKRYPKFKKIKIN